MKRFLFALPVLAAFAWLLFRVGGGTESIVSEPAGEEPISAEAPPREPLDPIERSASAQEQPAREAIPAEVELDAPAQAAEGRLLRFVVHAPQGHLADETVRLVMEKERASEFSGFGRKIDVTSEAFASDSWGMRQWEVTGEASGVFGDVLGIELPEGDRTRVRMEARCALLPAFESTELSTEGAPHELQSTPAGELRFRLVDGSGGGVDLPSFVGSALWLGASPITGLEEQGFFGRELGVVFDEALSASVWGLAGGARVTPQRSTLVAPDGSKARVMWAGTTLGPLPHGEIQVEVVPLASTEVLVLDDETGDPIPYGGLLLERTGGALTIRATIGREGRALVESSSSFKGELSTVVDGYDRLRMPYVAKAAPETLTLRLTKSPPIRGKAVDIRGLAVPGVSLRCHSIRHWEKTVVTGAQGEFSLPRPADHKFNITLRAEGAEFARRAPRGRTSGQALLKPAQYNRGDQDIVLTVVRSLTISGRAVDGAGEPLADGYVQAVFTPASIRSNRWNMYRLVGDRRAAGVANGFYRIKDLSPGRWTFTLWHHGTPYAMPPMEVLEDTVLDFRSDAQAPGIQRCRLSGRIVDGEGDPVEARVTLKGPSGPRSHKTDTTGAFQFGGLEPGRYSIVARSYGKSLDVGAASGLALGTWQVPATGGTAGGDLVALESVQVVCTARLLGGDLPNGYLANAIDQASGTELTGTYYSSGGPARLDVPVGRRVLLRLLDQNKNVVHESEHTFEAGSRPTVDLSPR